MSNRVEKEIVLASLHENFAEVEIFELKMQTKRKVFFAVTLVTPLCAYHMPKFSLATSEKCEWKSGLIAIRQSVVFRFAPAR